MIERIQLRYPLPIYGTSLSHGEKVRLSQSQYGVTALIPATRESILVPWSNIISISESFEHAENPPNTGNEGRGVSGISEAGEDKPSAPAKPAKTLRPKKPLQASPKAA